MYRIFSHISLKNCPTVGKYSILSYKHWFLADVPFGESKNWLPNAVRYYHDILWQSFISLQWKALAWSKHTPYPYIWMGNVLCVAMLWLISEPGRFDEGGWTRIFKKAPLPPKLDCYRDRYRGRSAKVIQSNMFIFDERQAFVGQIGLSQMLFWLVAADLLILLILLMSFVRHPLALAIPSLHPTSSLGSVSKSHHLQRRPQPGRRSSPSPASPEIGIGWIDMAGAMSRFQHWNR